MAKGYNNMELHGESRVVSKNRRVMTNRLKSGDTIKISITENDVGKYNKTYFKKYPRRSKPPIDSPTHPSINAWFIMGRPQMNDIKGKWKEFVVWLIQEKGLENLKIESCSMEFISYYRTRRRSDVDNSVPKFILDGMVEAGLIVDDDYFHLKELVLRCGYDKDRPRTDIFIHIL